ncbi:hypothetical protein N480_11400 [Pseudoalteromonas luteoviolacea S2607]|nr:hypothetical protein N480_11400 [Pseudoalteromonas luteoviolacea S2607]
MPNKVINMGLRFGSRFKKQSLTPNAALHQ